MTCSYDNVRRAALFHQESRPSARRLAAKLLLSTKFRFCFPIPTPSTLIPSCPYQLKWSSAERMLKQQMERTTLVVVLAPNKRRRRRRHGSSGKYNDSSNSSERALMEFPLHDDPSFSPHESSDQFFYQSLLGVSLLFSISRTPQFRPQQRISDRIHVIESWRWGIH